MANTKKYVSLSKLSTFLDKLKGLFATKESVENLSADVTQKSQVQIITWEADD